MTKEIKRELTAIMFTDIVGFTALSAKNEREALSLLDQQREILFPIIHKYNGSIRKEIGDGLLITFRTASESVQCGIEIQSTLKSNQELKLRIAIHEGEVAVRGNDVLGDDVNIAARLEPYSAVGGIVISGRVQQNISSLPEYKTEYMGHPELKGVAQSIDIYCITSNNLPMGKKIDSLSQENKISPRPRLNIFSLTGAILTFAGLIFWIYVGFFDVSYGSANEVPSVAILMMENLGNTQDEFWARGITEDLIVKFAGAGMLRVPSISTN
jgi:Adenylate cyclase, family 3 (some proteins contain HAMP domain)